jgi:uncharacterized membrane protein
MNKLAAHLRNKLLAGAVTAAPVVIIIFGAVWLEQHTQPLAELVGLPRFPGLGLLIGLVGVYLLGVVSTSLVGGIVARWMDYLLRRIPGLNMLYRAWKDTLFLPPGKTGVFHQVLLIPSREGGGTQVGFTSGESIAGDRPRLCVFVPSLPNPLSGQLVLFPKEACTPLPISVEEAFKFLLSTGNYLPPELFASIPSQLSSVAAAAAKDGPSSGSR